MAKWSSWKYILIGVGVLVVCFACVLFVVKRKRKRVITIEALELEALFTSGEDEEEEILFFKEKQC